MYSLALSFGAYILLAAVGSLFAGISVLQYKLELIEKGTLAFVNIKISMFIYLLFWALPSYMFFVVWYACFC